MKISVLKSVLGIASMFLCGAVVAQSPVITHTNQMHSIGDATQYVEANIPFGFDVIPAGGPDIHWNYFNLFPAGSITFNYDDPGTATGYANFPGAEEAMANSINPGHEWFDVVPDTIRRLGYTDPTAGDIYYDNGGFPRYIFPFEAGDFWSTSNYTANTTLNLSGPTTISNGSYSAYVDAYGTVTLPTGAITDVVRVRATESFDMVVDVVGTPFVVGTVYDDYYFWFHNDIKDPVLIYGATDLAPDPLNNPGSTKVLRYQDIATGIPTAEKRFQMKLDDGKLTLELPDVDEEIIKVVVTNILGTTIYDYRGKVSDGSLQIDLSHAAAGIHLVDLVSDDQRITRKFLLN